MEKKIRIAIDGPAAAGKSTVAKILAEKLQFVYVDTGAMYRALTYKAQQDGLSLENDEQVTELLKSIMITLSPRTNGQLVLLNDFDVTELIRTPEVTNSVSIVAKHAGVRKEMVERQQELAKEGGVVMDGRDIGTHVIPDAEVKIFLLASVTERAQRRHEENLIKGYSSDLEKLVEEIATRDKLDSEREISPLKKAEDAIEIDTTSLTIEEVVERILQVAKERME
ncbi:cytidylate kinase [Bacillus coahuilensis m2-6]|uniref:Cytidylate kinase n=1 Tax=Bacillus coahuilensis p1.1.43 TaxID=1150625 RepID=A0A147K8S3_9BACI|nr:(d)CMP kinase [Bacillus coahuilensis]KUP06593.1 cytidylate kinase [Bacillus coahuilensis p1.1.43]KUP07793.1 cytidylate kinase [Bacillus coahuilensis m2-6]